MKTGNIIYLSLIIFLSGCASGYKITYNTEPTGASVICNGANKGYSPVSLNYSPDENTEKIGTLQTVPCTAIWSSGVRKNFSNTWDLNEFPDGVMQTLQRPNGEGYSQDVEFSLKVQQMKNHQAAENAKAWRDLSRSLAESAERRRQNTPKTTFTNCSNTFGGINCTSTTY
jgi:hypothetical protein